MIDELTLKKALSSVIKSAFPNYHIYGQGIVEGYKYPAVFTELALTNMSDATINIVEKQYAATILYDNGKEPTAKEADNLKFVETLKKALQCIDDRNRKRKMCLKVADSHTGNRYLHISNLSFVYIGNDLDMLQVRFQINFYDSEEIPYTEPTMEHVDTEYNI